MDIKHNIIPKHKKRNSNSNISVDLYFLAELLYSELEKLGVIARLKDTNQLGIIKTKKDLTKSRYDYVILQLYFAQLIKQKIQHNLEMTLNNLITPKEFINFSYEKTDAPTVADVLQIFTFAYNIGHFCNTFAASRSVILCANENKYFRNSISSSSEDQHFKNALKLLIENHDYHRFHLLNSILILEKCNQNLFSIQLAKELIYSYINEDNLPPNSKLHYVFRLYRKIRNTSYISYDLQIAPTPITIDICNKESIVWLLNELMSKYNNKTSSENLFSSLSKLLDDTVYNNSIDAICYYQISKKISTEISKICSVSEIFYYDYFINKESIVNRKYPLNKQYNQENILKLTFNKSDSSHARNFFKELERTNNISAGYYDRHSGDITILVSLKNSCKYTKLTSFKVFKKFISFLRSLDCDFNDSRYLLVTKFFLHYLFDENKIIIQPTLHANDCVYCTKGHKKRTTLLKNLLEQSIAHSDQNHEVEFMHDYLSSDKFGDVTVTVPASIIVYKSNNALCEFDGLILFPNRKKDNIIFLEAKNTLYKDNYAKKCLVKKFKKIKINSFDYNFESINKDVLYKHTLE